MTAENAAWVLEEFIDSLVVELDKTRETLAVKAINKPLSYSVKEISVDLNAFPTYNGDEVKFITAQPGQTGASKLTIQLGSITDQQVRATTKAPASRNDAKFDTETVPLAARKSLRKLGISSVDDLQQVERKNVDLNKVSDGEIDYSSLANHIEKSRRSSAPPSIRGISLSMDAARPYLTVRGRNLAVNPDFPPVAVLNGALVDVLSSSPGEIRIALGREHDLRDNNELILTVDPYAVLKVNVKASS